MIGKKKARKRVLSDKEIRAVWWAAERLGYPYGPITQIAAAHRDATERRHRCAAGRA